MWMVDVYFSLPGIAWWSFPLHCINRLEAQRVTGQGVGLQEVRCASPASEGGGVLLGSTAPALGFKDLLNHIATTAYSLPQAQYYTFSF